MNVVINYVLNDLRTKRSCVKNWQVVYLPLIYCELKPLVYIKDHCSRLVCIDAMSILEQNLENGYCRMGKFRLEYIFRYIH